MSGTISLNKSSMSLQLSKIEVITNEMCCLATFWIYFHVPCPYRERNCEKRSLFLERPWPLSCDRPATSEAFFYTHRSFLSSPHSLPLSVQMIANSFFFAWYFVAFVCWSVEYCGIARAPYLTSSSLSSTYHVIKCEEKVNLARGIATYVHVFGSASSMQFRSHIHVRKQKSIFIKTTLSNMLRNTRNNNLVSFSFFFLLTFHMLFLCSQWIDDDESSAMNYWFIALRYDLLISISMANEEKKKVIKLHLLPLREYSVVKIDKLLYFPFKIVKTLQRHKWMLKWKKNWRLFHFRYRRVSIEMRVKDENFRRFSIIDFSFVRIWGKESEKKNFSFRWFQVKIFNSYALEIELPSNC